MLHQHLTVHGSCLSVNIIQEAAAAASATVLVHRFVVHIMLLLAREVVVNKVASDFEAFVLARPAFERFDTSWFDNKFFDCTKELDRKFVDMALRPGTEPAAKTQSGNRRECLDVGFKVSAEFVNANWHCPLLRVSSMSPAWL
jgi:hypothetical protein